MASSIPIKTRRLTRDKIAAILKSQELIKAFENIIEDVTVTLPDSTIDVTDELQQLQNSVDALGQVAFIVLSADGAAPKGRTLTVGSGLSLTDNGPGEQVVLDVAPNLGTVLAADISENAGLFVNALDLALTLKANTAYMVDGVFAFQSNANIPSVGLGFALPSGATISGKYAFTIDIEPLTAAPAPPGADSATGPLALITGRWLIKTSAEAGMAQLRFKSMLPTYSVTLKGGRCALIARQIE